MIPVRLIMEGIYSYQQRQEIDFETLTAAGLFGIFGTVGSGKSSILEAITFALFGESNRLNSRDKRGYNMMNLKSNRMFVSFDFYNYENRLFRITRELKRNSKKFEDVRTPEVSFNEWKNDEWIPVGHSDVSKVIGLNYENFKRTIIIPQGQFKEFIELGGTEKTKMMQDIFRLGRFDLYGRAKDLETENNSQIDRLNGSLQMVNYVTEEEIALQKEELEKAKKQTEEVKAKLAAVEKRFSELQQVKNDAEELQHLQDKQNELAAKSTDFERLQAKTEKFEKAKLYFEPVLTKEKEAADELATKLKDLKDNKQKFARLNDDLQKTVQSLASVAKEYEQLDARKQELRELDVVKNILKCNDIIATERPRIQKGIDEVEKLERDMLQTASSIGDLENQIKDKKSQQLDTGLLMEVGAWYQQKKTFAQNIANAQTKIDASKAKIQKQEQALEKSGFTAKNFEQLLQQQKVEVAKAKKKAELKLQSLHVKMELAAFAQALEDGHPCPLCGSTEHPEILHAKEDYSGQAEVLAQSISRQENEITKIDERRSAIKEQVLQIRNEKEFLSQRTEEKQLATDTLDGHLRQFHWPDFDAEDGANFEQKKQQSLALHKAIEALEKGLDDLRKSLTAEQSKKDKYKEAVREIEQKVADTESQARTYHGQLQQLQWDDFKDMDTSVLEMMQREKAQNIAATERDFTHFTAKKNALDLSLNTLQTEAKHLNERIAELNGTIEKQQQAATDLLSKYPFENIAEVKHILAENIDLQQSRKALEAYRSDCQATAKRMAEIKSKLGDKMFDPVVFAQVETDKNNLTTAKDDAIAKMSSLTQTLENLETDFQKKKEFEKQMKDLQNRKANIQVLLSLFKGKGFVEYVSTIYLRQLVEQANVRFHRMTRNQLSLKLNSDNDFEIIDYLNEGRSRSVKTLSGGQSFQVSLSLALALAESVQSNAVANRNFFFIDEGFGTQDAESVNLVFETLQNLRNEHRIVGIISHVDELKERIPVSLEVRKDSEKGSLVEMNFG